MDDYDAINNLDVGTPHDRTDIDLVPLAITDNLDELTIKEFDELQSALIIRADTSEPAHFMQCIEERLCYYVKNPKLFKTSEESTESHWTRFMLDQKCIFKKVDRINESSFCSLQPQVMRSFLRGYNIVFFTLYSGTYTGFDSVVVGVINDLINSGELSVVFLRGAGRSVPMRLGFVRRKDANDGYVEYTDGTYVQLLLQNIKQLDNQSLTIFVNKCMNKLENRVQTIGEVEETIEDCLKLDDLYICGVCDTTLSNVNDWHLLARSVSEREKYPWVIHKTKKVMFTPWYGYSHGNENQCLLTLYALRYLLYEHMKHFHNINSFKSNLLIKIINNQLSDISIDFE
ncbi:predicted protein [Naegleria gruberi]|uniref:Predicted protein n=1 Tax=Naegleria gruberi TaxID=5762 RepID=D2VSK0_NAEGR|nr:uncharacterized protein NAEGRDRAFT_71968 [Naegleria gruberi]EFC40135.1 predicted protein [Naegleria gruberi]|eukprot:XP_002672879.1 predicted protein [Naegleria gruberi strain NEG-M]